MIITINKNDSALFTKLSKYLDGGNLIYRYKIVGDCSKFLILSETTTTIESEIKKLGNIISIKHFSHPYKLASREFHPENTIVEVNGIKIGGGDVVFMCGPCAVESKESILTIANGVKQAGGNILRGGAYKPRTSPYSFQGLHLEGINDLVIASKQTGLPIVSEIVSIDQIDEFVKNVDIIQVGARNMQNFELLKALGKLDKPILLKRGLAATIEEWLMAAEYILNEGNQKVILCERGIRTFEKATRNTLDLSAVPYIKKVSHLPIIVDPSHATGKRELIYPMTLAAIACGADGVMMEVHNHPTEALSDGEQSISFNELSKIISKAKEIAEIIRK